MVSPVIRTGFCVDLFASRYLESKLVLLTYLPVWHLVVASYSRACLGRFWANDSLTVPALLNLGPLRSNANAQSDNKYKLDLVLANTI